MPRLFGRVPLFPIGAVHGVANRPFLHCPRLYMAGDPSGFARALFEIFSLVPPRFLCGIPLGLLLLQAWLAVNSRVSSAHRSRRHLRLFGWLMFPPRFLDIRTVQALRQNSCGRRQRRSHQCQMIHAAVVFLIAIGVTIYPVPTIQG